MNKRWLVVPMALVLALSFGLTACGGNGGKKGGDKTNGNKTEEVYGEDGHLHNAAHYRADETSHWKICESCGEKFAESEHDGDACSVCNYFTGYTEGLEIDVLRYDEGTMTDAMLGSGECAHVFGLGTATAEDIVIPAYYKTYPVIGVDQFDDDSQAEIPNVKSITLSDTVEYFCLYETFPNLEKITMSKNIKIISIDDESFAETPFYLNEENWEGDLLYAGAALLAVKETASGVITVKEGTRAIYDYMLYDNENITDLELPESLVYHRDYLGRTQEEDFEWDDDGLYYIGNHLVAVDPDFEGEVVIRDGTTEIQSETFMYHEGITGITIPASVTSIGPTMLYDCFNLQKIVVDEKNEAYYSEGNCVIEKKTKKIVAGCKNPQIPDDVLAVAEGAFFYEDAEASWGDLVIPDNIKVINPWAFSGGFGTVTLSKGIKYLTYGAFVWCEIDNFIWNAENCEVARGTILSWSNQSNQKSAGEGFFDLGYGGNSITTFTVGEDVKQLDAYVISGLSHNWDGLEELVWNAEDCKLITDEEYIGFGNPGPDENSQASGYIRDDVYVETITIGEGVKKIPANLFCGVFATEISIPASVTEIGKRAFSLWGQTTITFGGTSDAWKAVQKDAEWIENIVHLPDDFAVQCTDKSVPLV